MNKPHTILHITPVSKGYHEVNLIANKVNRKNNLAVIEKDGQISYTGGFLIQNTPRIRQILDAIPREDQYEFVHSFKMDPFEKLYYEEGE